jgi:thymidylate synthase
MMRSTDVPYGLPYNIMSYSLLTTAIAKLIGLEVGEIIYFGNDAHIYVEQLPMIQEQLKRDPKPLPKLIIKKDLKTIDDLLSMEYNDIYLDGYEPHPDFKDKPKMAVG